MWKYYTTNSKIAFMFNIKIYINKEKNNVDYSYTNLNSY